MLHHKASLLIFLQRYRAIGIQTVEILLNRIQLGLKNRSGVFKSAVLIKDAFIIFFRFTNIKAKEWFLDCSETCNFELCFFQLLHTYLFASNLTYFQTNHTYRIFIHLFCRCRCPRLKRNIGISSFFRNGLDVIVS